MDKDKKTEDEDMETEVRVQDRSHMSVFLNKQTGEIITNCWLRVDFSLNTNQVHTPTVNLHHSS